MLNKYKSLLLQIISYEHRIVHYVKPFGKLNPSKNNRSS